MKRIIISTLLVALAFLLLGCGLRVQKKQGRESQDSGAGKKTVQKETMENAENSTENKVPEASTGMDENTGQEMSDFEEATTEAAMKKKPEKRVVVAIDPGHQARQNSDTEPIGPGASEEKMKVTSGTSGISTGKEEHELNLEVSLKLRDRLEQLGYQVVMIRESADVDISNAERAAIANDAKADVFIRIHANSDDDSSVNGILTMCQTPNNPYNGELYQKSRLLSDCILDHTAQTTGARKRDVIETDTMSGINWAKVPTTILEMGFMSNPEEDERMATDSYQKLIVDGIVDGIADYLKRSGK